MPSFTTIVEDTSPVLLYSTNWRAGISGDDPSADQYTQSSFTVTKTTGATMNFLFYGSSIGIFGARRANHGNYQVQLDNQTFPTLNGASNVSQFNQTLFSTTVDLGFHQLRFTNGGDTFLDIDYIEYETSIGADNEALIVNMFQDSHPSFVYIPSSSWTNPDLLGSFLGGSGHATTDPLAVANFTFQGDAVALYGPVGPKSTSIFSVQVDDASPFSFSAQKQFYRPQQMLFYAGHLGPGLHILLIRTASTGIGALAIDFANVYTTPSLGGSFGTPIMAAANGTLTSSHIPTGMIAGLAFTSILALFSTIGFIYLFWRRRRDFSTLSLAEKPVLGPNFVQPFITADPIGHIRSFSQATSQPTISSGQPYAHDLAGGNSGVGFPASTSSHSQSNSSGIYEKRTPKHRLKPSYADQQRQLRALAPSQSARPQNLTTAIATTTDDIVQISRTSPAATEIAPPEYTQNPNNPGAHL